MSDKERWEKLLDKAIEEVRQDTPAAEVVETSAQRVWERVSGDSSASESIQGCQGMQLLVPEFLKGSLGGARRLLFEDHIRNCVSCRRVLKEAQGRAVRLTRRRVRGHSIWWKWGGAAAAAALLLVTLTQLGVWSGWRPDTSAWARVESATGPVYRVSRLGTALVETGFQLTGGERIRTPRGVQALLRLADGSQIEMAERSELSLHEGIIGNTIQLQRGSIIVEAADRDSGRLFVATDEFRVAVKGTVFSVNHGIKGSRVAVLEGEVWVNQQGQDTVLRAGEQYASHPRLNPINMTEEIRWSSNFENHRALLSELAQLGQQMSQATFSPELRYSSQLLNRIPDGTIVYAAFPNLSSQLDDFYQLFQERIRSNESLRSWYEHQVGTDKEALIRLLLQKVRSYGQQLGTEILLALVQDSAEGHPQPLLLAEVLNPEVLRSQAEAELPLLNLLSPDRPVAAVISEVEQAAARQAAFYVLVNSQVIAASPSAAVLEEVVAKQQGDRVGGLANERFYQTLLNTYSDGVDWLFAVNLQDLLALEKRSGDGLPLEGTERLALDMLGVEQVLDLVIERKQVGGLAEHRAVVTFDRVGEGLLSWIAEPGPMGGLEFVSPDAHLAAAFVVADPARLVDDLLDYLSSAELETWNELIEFQQQLGLDLRNDLAAALGGEAVFALDGAVLPTPSWKLIVEVYDAQRLQQTLRLLLDEFNRQAEQEGHPALVLTTEESGPTLFYSLQTDHPGAGIEYLYTNGYLIAGPNREVLNRAIQFQETRYSLSSAPHFVSLLPQGRKTNMSALFYNDLSSLLEPVTGLGQLIEGVSPEAQDAIGQMVNAPPMLWSLYSEPGRLILNSSGDIESLWWNLAALSAGGQRWNNILRGSVSH